MGGIGRVAHILNQMGYGSFYVDQMVDNQIFNDDVLIDVISQFTDPFDALRVMSTNRQYSRYLDDPEFGRDLIQRKFGVDYRGNDVRSVYIALSYGLDTKFKDMNPKYHWYAYLYYFSGAVFDARFMAIGENAPEYVDMEDQDEIDREINRNLMNVRDYSRMPEDVIFDITRRVNRGETLIIFTDGPVWILLGNFEDIEPHTLFSVSNPLDIEIWELTESINMPVTVGGEVVEGISVKKFLIAQLAPTMIENLNIDTNVESIWEGTFYGTNIRRFIRDKIGEANDAGADEILDELTMILEANDELNRNVNGESL